MTQTHKRTSKKITRSSLASHAVTSLLSVAPHIHTGRSLHRTHTSHGALLVALLLTGVLLFSNLGALKAYGVTSNGSHTVTVNVAGAPPATGADITYPTHNSITKSPLIEVKGTCEPETLVATYNDGTFAGSSICTIDGDYATTIQLHVGVNILQSQNYDALNQPGPVTNQVTITREADPVVTPEEPIGAPIIPEIATTPTDIAVNPIPPVTTPATQPAENPCYQIPKTSDRASTAPIIFVSCVDRTIFANETLSLPVIISGGVAPFALSIDWGDGVTDLKSVADNAYYTYQHIYLQTGSVSVTLRTTDSKGSVSFLQTVVQVNGAPATTGSTFGNITSGLSNIWTEAPVPLYFAALALVLGFWIGDIFQRYFNSKKPKASTRRRHA